MTIPKITCPQAPFFWNWFRTKLCWPFLLVGGPITCLCEGIARTADAVLQDIEWFAAQFSPATCEPEYVDRFGAARGLSRHFRETEEMWRRRVCAAYAWHKLAGRTMGMPKILDHYGYTGSVMINLADEGQPDKWAHFRVDFGGDYPVTVEEFELIRWILAETKPAKSILDSLRLILSPKATLYAASVLIGGTRATIGPYIPPVYDIPGSIITTIKRQSWHRVTIAQK